MFAISSSTKQIWINFIHKFRNVKRFYDIYNVFKFSLHLVCFGRHKNVSLAMAGSSQAISRCFLTEDKVDLSLEQAYNWPGNSQSMVLVDNAVMI